MARPAGERSGVAYPQSESAGTLVAGIVSLGAPTRREPQADAHLRRTRLRRQAREPSVDGADRRRQNRTGLRASVDVLLIDEFGYLNLKPEQSNTFFKLMEERYTRHSTILTTNLGYDEWQNFPGNKSMVDALLSRVRHYCHT